MRVNQQGAGGAKKTKRRQPWADPVGGLTTKIHLAADERGRAGRIIVGPGQQSDYRQAAALIEGFKPQAVLADRGYDADWLVEALRRQGVAHVVIPSRSNRKVQRQIDKDLYKERNKIERYFCRLKTWRRVASRFDKTATNFLSLIHFAAALINFHLTINTAYLEGKATATFVILKESWQQIKRRGSVPTGMTKDRDTLI